MRAEDPTAKQRRVWDTAARGYDKQIAWFERVLLGGGRDWLGQRAQGRLLEVAIGTGRNLPYYGDDVRLTGVDLSPAMLGHARVLATELGRDVDVREGDAARLPFTDGSFDTVVCALALCSIPDPVRALAEMHRVLVPGGRLLLVDHIGSSWPPIYVLQWLTERITIRLAGEYFTRRQRDAVVATGFELVETERLKAGMVERIHARKAG